MSRYWCIEDERGKELASGSSDEWPTVDAVVYAYMVHIEVHCGCVDDTNIGYYKSVVANDVYAILRSMRPYGGEIPWSEVPYHVKEITAVVGDPAKVCVSF